jgi:hypothetical protein
MFSWTKDGLLVGKATLSFTEQHHIKDIIDYTDYALFSWLSCKHFLFPKVAGRNFID